MVSTHNDSDVSQVALELWIQRDKEALGRRGAGVRDGDVGCDFGQVRAQVDGPLHLLVQEGAIGLLGSAKPGQQDEKEGY